MSYEEYDNDFIYEAYSDSSPSSSDVEEASSSIPPDFFQKISSNLEEKVGGPVANGISRDIQNLVNSDDSHLVTQPILPKLEISQPTTSSKSPIMPEQRPFTADMELIDVNMENANDDTTIPPQPSGSTPLTALQTSKSKNSSGSSKASKTKDSSKKSKNSRSSKTHSTNSKPNKEKTKTLKKSTDKKKKKSSGKKADNKMDIVKLLLTLISKF
ncbi:hypothetical protein RCL_jg19566.t1 [Rhizophagus clarus]|uniref:Uncharacterized protein n=1 Tax=Rhizophagus clarus TaxID=94130 RepID=A0A8H3LDX6_9GLOM|nr:hypothetical protein RCL_jg19566.t1 [Rhizophagus clarus]